MKTSDLADRREHRLGRRRGRPRHVHAGGVRLPRGGPDADEERRRTSPARTCSSSALPRSSTGPSASGIAFGRRQRGDRHEPGSSHRSTSLLSVGAAPFSFFTTIPGAAAYLFEVVFCGRLTRDRLGCDGRAARSSGSTSRSASSSRSSTPSCRTGSGTPAAGCSESGCRTSPARRSSTTRARLQRSPGRFLLGPRIGKFGKDGRAEPDSRPQHGLRDARDAHPLVRLVRVQSRLDAERRLRR